MLVDTPATGIFTLDPVLSEAECAAWIARGEAEGFDEAPITMMDGFERVPSVRNNTRAMFDDPAAAAALWARIAPEITSPFGVWHVIGLNERLRVYRYLPGQYFKWHRDGAFVRSGTEHSLFTLMIYLDAPLAGGATRLRPRGTEVVVQPRPGLALAFLHDIIHQGDPVEAGAKHVLRTDVMYRVA